MLATRMKISTWEPKPFPTVAATNTFDNTGSNNSSTNCSLPASIVAGDLLIVFIGSGRYDAVYNTPSGWGQLFQGNTGDIGELDDAANLAIFYKIADGSEGSSVTITNSSSARSLGVSLKIRDYSGVPEIATDTGESLAPNPPILSPSWGNTSTLWIALAAFSPEDVALVSRPINYAETVTKEAKAGGSFAISTSVVQRNFISSQENPGSYTLDASAFWISATIAIKPA